MATRKTNDENLGPAPKRVRIERSGSPVPSYQSLKSDASMDPPRNFKGENTVDQRVWIERSGSPVPSDQSLKSNASMDPPRNFKGENTVDQRVGIERSGSPVPSYQSLKSNASMDPPRNFKGENTVGQRVPMDRSGSPGPSYQSLKSDASMNLPYNFRGQSCDDKRPLSFREFSHLVEESSGTLSSPRPQSRSCKKLKHEGLLLERDSERHALDESIERAQQALKAHLKEKFECVFEAKQGYQTLLNEIYTELYITEGGSVGVNNEHEVRLIETASRRRTTQDTAIPCNDIFKPLPGKKEPRTVFTKGIAGIGKTVSVQKFILDWAEGKANQDIACIFTLPFRDLNLKKDQEFSLMRLLQHYFPQLKGIKGVEDGEVKVLFIFDGLDECRLPLDFQSSEICRDITEVTSVDVLLTNLIQGNLLPSALLWITSRPAAANQIPPECVDMVTEIQGFNDPQKEEYFRKRIRDQEKASRIILHIKSVRSLYIMCHIPVFCWISATVLETMLGRAESGDLPKTLTEMYTHFLLIQTDLKNKKYRSTNGTNPKEISESDAEVLLKLGRLAFQQLEKGNLIFYEEDLLESGIDVREASVYSGVCTEIFKEECGLDQEKVYCFVHLSIQEYLAALFALHSWVNRNINVLAAEEMIVGENVNHHGSSQDETADEEEESYYFDEAEEALSDEEGDSDIDDDDDVEEEIGSDEEEAERDGSDQVQLSKVHKAAVDQALESPNGHLDLFLRFLLGLSLDSTQTLLRKLLTQSGRGSFPPDGQEEINLKTAKYIKKKIRKESSAERTINLFHCLNELNDDSLVEEIQTSLRSGTLSDKELAPSQCSALAFVLLMSEEVLDEFDLKTFNTSAAGHDRLVPVVRNCRKATLKGCDLTVEACKIVASVLQSPNSLLRDLDLSHMEDAGMKLLCAGIINPNCELQRLGLNSCYLTKDSYEILASTLLSSNSPLRDLDLSYNNLGDSGVELLCTGLMSPNCKLQRLGLGWCDITEGSCDILASVLRSPHSELRDLELRDNDLQDSGVRALSAGLEDPHCKLQRLGLSGCGVTQRGCDSLASALSSNPSHLRELDLRYNHPGDSGVRALSAAKPGTLTMLVDNGGENRTKPGPRKYGCELTLDPNTAHRELSLSKGNRKVTHTPGREEPYPDHPERFEDVRQVLCRESLFERCYWEVESSLFPQGEISVAVTGKQIGRKGFSCNFDESKHAWSLQCDSLTDPDELRFSVSHFKTHAQMPDLPSPYRRARVCGDDHHHNDDDDYDPDDDNHDDRDYDPDDNHDSDDEDDNDDNHDGSDDDPDDDDDNIDDRDDQDDNDDNHDDGDDEVDNYDNHDGDLDDDANVYRVGVYVDRPANTLSFYSISNSDTLTLLHRFHTHFTQHTPLCAGFRVYDSWVSLCQVE